MAEYILNLLPVTEEEKLPFRRQPPGRPRLRRAAHCDSGAAGTGHHPFRVAPARRPEPRPPPEVVPVHVGGDRRVSGPGVLPEGVVLTSSAGPNSQSVAEHALACLLALCRRLPQCRAQQRERLWTDPGKMKTLSGATVLVAGAGHIGSWFAGLCRGWVPILWG